jgi:hypothetical protein
MAPAVHELSQLESKAQLLYLKRHFGKDTRNINWIASSFVELKMIWSGISEGEYCWH